MSKGSLHPRTREAISDWLYRRKWLWYPIQAVRFVLLLAFLAGFGWYVWHVATGMGEAKGWR